MADLSHRKSIATLARGTIATFIALLVISGGTGVHAQPAASTNATLLTVTMSNYTFQPSQFDFQRGTPYRLHLINSSDKGHSFAAPKLFSASQIAPADQAKIEDGKIEVGGGESIDFAFTPMTSGEYEIRCTHFMHSMFGMHAKAVVQ